MNLNLTKYIKSDNKRTATANKNALGNIMVKSISIIIGFLSVRLYLDYLGQESYGVWLTITSFYAWFTFFEFGLGNGLRNKLSQAMARREYGLAKTYVSTTYFLLSIIVITFVLTFLIVNRFIDWQSFLNTTVVENRILYTTTNIVFILFFVQFVVKVISFVLLALQKTTLSFLINPLSNLINFCIIFILYKLGDPASLVKLGLIVSLTPVILALLLSIYFYSSSLKNIAPSIYHIRIKYTRDLLGLGMKFFLIQICQLVMFQSSNIIIAKLIGSEDVVIYDVTRKLFLVFHMVFALILAPLWSAYTEAWELNDFSWIHNTIKKNIKLWLALMGISLIVAFASPLIFKIWLGDGILIPISLTFLLWVNSSIRTFEGIFISFLNGISVLKMQFICTLIGAIIFIPLSYLLIKHFSLGLSGLVIAGIISNFYGPVISPIQYFAVMKKKRKA